MSYTLFDLDVTLRRVKEELSKYLLTDNNQLVTIEVIRTFERLFSRVVIVKIHTTQDSQFMVVKTIGHHPINIGITGKENQAVVEYNVLNYLYPKFSKIKECSVPRPILVIPDIDSFVMEFVAGAPLDHELDYARYFSSRLNFQKLSKNFHQVGYWLKNFQQFVGFQRQKEGGLQTIMERCEQRLKVIEELNTGSIPKDFRKRVQSILDQQLSRLSGREILVSGRHGDFGPWNIIARSDGITVIDFLGYALEPVAVDIIKMLINFEDEMKNVTYNPQKVKTLRQAFLEGYGPLPEVETEVSYIIEILYRVSSIYASLYNTNLPFHRRIEKHRCLQTHLRWFAGGEDRQLLWSTITHN